MTIPSLPHSATRAFPPAIAGRTTLKKRACSLIGRRFVPSATKGKTGHSLSNSGRLSPHSSLQSGSARLPLNVRRQSQCGLAARYVLPARCPTLTPPTTHLGRGTFPALRPLLCLSQAVDVLAKVKTTASDFHSLPLSVVTSIHHRKAWLCPKSLWSTP